MKINNEELSIEKLVEDINPRANLMKNCGNNIYLSDNQIEILKQYGFTYQNYSNLKSLIFDIEEYINENYRGDCSLKAIAAAVQISPNHLHVVFKRETGVTPFAYVLKKRIVHAQRLIVTGEMSMLEIALESGFCSQSHFNKAFRAATGVTPVQYRKNLLQQGVDKYDG